MALKATKLMREALRKPTTAEGLRDAAMLLIEARDWAQRHYQPRLAATAKRLLAENYNRKVHAAV